MSKVTVMKGGVPYTAGTLEKANSLAGITSGASSDAGATDTRVQRYPTNTKSTGSSTSTDAAENAYQGAAQPKSYADIEQETIGSYSSELAAIRAASAAALAAQDPVNKADEGRTRAASAAAGTIGTDFGNSEQSAAERTSVSNNEKIRADYLQKEGDVYAAAEGAAQTRYNAEHAQDLTAKKDKVDYTKDQITQSQAKIQTIASATTLKDLSQDEYDSLYAHSGFNTPEEFNAFYEAAHVAALQGTKLVGDATTGYYVPQIDPTTGGLTYKNVIKPIVKPTQYGAYEFDPATGDVKTIAKAQPKIMTSGGRIWSVDPATNKAVPLTARVAAAGASGKVGYAKANLDQQLAVHAWIQSQAGGDDARMNAALQKVQTNPDAFMTALNGALESGIYVPAAVSQDTSNSDAAASSAAQAAQDAADAAANAANNQDSGGEGVN